jgi:putative aldouronate transport system substrate-binding protein
MKKTGMCLVLALSLLQALAWAGGSAQGSQASGSAGKVVINVYAPGNVEEFPAGEDENNNRIINYIREKTGYDVRWTIAPNANAREAMNMLMASGSPPDMFYIADKNMFTDYVSQRLINPVDDFIGGTKNIGTIVPNESWRAVESGGKRWAVPVPQNQFASGGVIARTDYLEKLGNPKLETVDDFVKVFQLALDRKIGGADTIPLIVQSTAWDLFALNYGLGVEYDDFGNGRLESTWISENARSYLKFMADLYKRKLIDQEYVVNTTGQIVQEKISNGRGLMYTGNWIDMNTLERTIKNNDKAFGVIPPPKNAKGDIAYFNLNAPVRVYFLFPVQSKKTKDAIAFLDRCIDDDIRLVISYGWENEHYVRKTQNGVEIIEQTPEAENIRYRIYYNMWDTQKDFENRVNLKGFASGYYPMREFTKKRNLMDYAPPIAAVTEYSQTLKDLKDEYFLKIITGAWGIEKFDEFVSRWRSSGGDQVLKDINTWYVSFK